MESIGFKEWAIVCEALGDGRQSVILRKGGIAEGRDGFAFRYSEFFLFPTFFHEQLQKTRLKDAIITQPNESEIDVRFFAKIEQAFRIDSWEIAKALEPLHILQRSVVRGRFDYDSVAGLHVAFVRVFRVEPRWLLPNKKSYAGCRSWVHLPACPAAMRFESVLADSEHAKRKEKFVRLVNGQQDVATALRRRVGASAPR